MPQKQSIQKYIDGWHCCAMKCQYNLEMKEKMDASIRSPQSASTCTEAIETRSRQQLFGVVLF
jgi:hypothetical protein